MTPSSPLNLAYLAEPNEVLAREWMAFFAGRGHEVTLIARAEAVIQDGLDRRIQVRRMRPFSGLIRGRFSVFNGRRALSALLGTLRPDLVHVHDLTTGFGWLTRATGFHPYVLTTWGSDIYLALQRSWRSRLVGRLTVSAADLITMESRDLERATIQLGGHADRIRLIQFGVDTTRYAPGAPDPKLRERLGLTGRRVLFAPRQIAPLYDHVSLVTAAARLPADVVVLMSARNAHPDYLRTVRSTADAQGLGERLVVLPGIAHDDMPALYRLADVVVSVPFSDSISVSVLEAMACGRTVVATDLASPREWLAALGPDFLVPAGDPAALFEALRHALELSPNERARLGAEARQIVIDRAERETNMLQMEDLYQSVVEAHRARLDR